MGAFFLKEEEKAGFPIRQTWRMQKRKHRMEDDAALKYREQDEEERDVAFTSDAEDEKRRRWYY